MKFYMTSIDLKKMIVRDLVALTLGVLFCIFPNLSARLMVMVIGIAVLVLGIVSFLSIFTKKEYSPKFMDWFYLVLCIAVGIALLIVPSAFINIFTVLLGIILAVDGISEIATLLHARKWGVRTGFWEYIFGILLTALGIVLCFRPGASTATLFILFGAGCIFYALSDLIVLLRVRKRLRALGKVFKNDTVTDAENIEDIDYEEVK